MSYTEIYSFGKDGNPRFLGKARNSHRGAMQVWTLLEKKYLPQYDPGYPLFGDFKPTRVLAILNEKAMDEIWALATDPKVSETDRIVLNSTFDNVIILRGNVPKLLEALRAFEGETNLSEQADIIEQGLADDSDIIAIGYNQTSVNGDTWETKGGYDEENDEPIPYNILTGEDHWELFSNITSLSEEA